MIGWFFSSSPNHLLMMLASSFSRFLKNLTKKKDSAKQTSTNKTNLQRYLMTSHKPSIEMDRNKTHKTCLFENGTNTEELKVTQGHRKQQRINKNTQSWTLYAPHPPTPTFEIKSINEKKKNKFQTLVRNLKNYKTHQWAQDVYNILSTAKQNKHREPGGWAKFSTLTFMNTFAWIILIFLSQLFHNLNQPATCSTHSWLTATLNGLGTVGCDMNAAAPLCKWLLEEVADWAWC